MSLRPSWATHEIALEIQFDYLFFKKRLFKFLFYVSCIVCAPCVCRGHIGQKKVSENHHAGIRIQSQVLCKNSQGYFFKQWVISVPKFIFIFLVFVCVCVWCLSIYLHQVDAGPCGGGKLCWIPTGVMQSCDPPHAEAETGPASSTSAASVFHLRAISSHGLMRLNLEV